MRGVPYRGDVRIAILNWRDTANPEGGGSEIYIEEIARRLAARGHAVTLVCAAHDGAPALERRDGIRILRRGTKLTVYREARRLLRSGALGPLDVIVDTQNGIPFLSPWAIDLPVVVLVHHVHREQWPVVYDPLRARIGWWVESSLAPRVYRGRPYVAVSRATADELAALGVPADRISIVHNGTQSRRRHSRLRRDEHPRILVLGRLVPHKRVEHVLEAAAALRNRHPGLTVAVVGDGWWAPELHRTAARLGVTDIVEFTGHVSEDDKIGQIDRAWVLALPSLKEGWGLVVLESASAGVPTVAYREAGGVTESVRHGETGILVSDGIAFTNALDDVLANAELREHLGARAQAHASAFSWDESARAFEEVLSGAISSWTRKPRRAYRPWGARRSAMR